MVRRLLALASCLAVAAASSACSAPESGPSLSRERRVALKVGDRVPMASEREVSGPIVRPIARGTPAFGRLVTCKEDSIVFKDEEGTGADRMMTPRLHERLVKLAAKVRARWPRLTLRVTEAWDEDMEHGEGSLHYEGRAADITTSDVDAGKLGDLARLAAESSFDWVYFEDASHVHVSVAK